MGRVTGSLRWERGVGVLGGCSPAEVTTLYVERHSKHVYTTSYLGGNVPGELAVNVATTPA